MLRMGAGIFSSQLRIRIAAPFRLCPIECFLRKKEVQDSKAKVATEAKFKAEAGLHLAPLDERKKAVL